LAIRLFDRELAMKKGYVNGTHRTRPPRETFDDYKRHMALMGITRVANLTGLDTIGLPVHTAIRPNSKSVATTQGKGMDIDAARTSALMESIEGWHAENIDLPLRWEPYLSLRRKVNVIDVHRLTLHKDGVLRLDRPLHWIEGFDLIQQRPMWVPYELVWLSWVTPPEFRFTFFPSSNGLASGNHLLEAISHALCELIERDADALWKASDGLVQVDRSTIDDPDCVQLIGMLEQAGVHTWISDITSDVGIPAYTCFIMEPPDGNSGRNLGIYNGFGCHLSPRVALMRALTEAVQSRVTYIAGSRDELLYENYQELSDPELQKDVWAEMAGAPATQKFRREDLARDSFEEDVATLLSALQKIGITNAVAVDLTKPELGIPVVRCVVPSLEGPDHDACLRGQRVAERAGVP
jgi:ribosomal protein S12 methylthiotransferase accessory factor